MEKRTADEMISDIIPFQRNIMYRNINDIETGW